MRRTNTHVAGSAAAVGLLLLAACGGGGDDAAPSTSTSTTVVTTPPTTTSPATTAPPTTPAPTAPPTTSPPTAPPTTAPPTTQPRDVIAEVTAAAFTSYDAYWECLRAPAQCDPGRVAVASSEAFASLEDTTVQMAAAGLFVGQEDPGYLVVESVEQQGDLVLVSSCWSLTAVLYGPPGPDGQPTIQNNTPGYARQLDEYGVDPSTGTWRLVRTVSYEPEANVNECPPES